MANILIDSTLWESLQDVTPPPSWDGPNGWFEWFGVFGVGAPAQGIRYIGNSADIPLSMSVRIVTGADNYDVPTYLRFTFVAPGGNTTQDILLTESSTATVTVNIPLTATSVEVDIRSNPSFTYTYSMDITLTGLSAVDRPPDVHTIEVRYSNDGGHNYSDWRSLQGGKTGDFLRPMVLRRLGMCRHRTWEIQDTSAYAADIVAASIQIEGQ